MLSIKNMPDGPSNAGATALHAVIFNADDFGLSRSANAGIIACHERGVVRSTSLMTGGGAFDEAADYALKNPSLDLGLHLALCEARPVSDPGVIPSLVDRDGKLPVNFAAFLKCYFSGKIRMRDVKTEFRKQLRKALDAGLRISHLDSHQHLHALPAIFEIVLRLAKENGIPAVRRPDERNARIFSNPGRLARSLQRAALSMLCRLDAKKLARFGVASTDHFSGFMEMGRWNENSLRAAIQSLRPGVTEICCHPRSGPDAASEPGCGFQHESAVFSSDGLPPLLKAENVRVTSFREWFMDADPPSENRA